MKDIHDRIEDIIKGSSKSVRVEYEAKKKVGLEIPDYAIFKTKVLEVARTLTKNAFQGKDKEKANEILEGAIKRMQNGTDSRLEAILKVDYEILKVLRKA